MEHKGNLIKLIKNAHNLAVTSVCITSDNNYIISGSADKSIKIWNIEGKLINAIKYAHDKAESVCMSSYSKYIISGSDDNSIKIWDIKGKYIN